MPAVVWRVDTMLELNLELNRWIMALGAFVLFSIFGFTQEACDKCRAALQAVARVFITITGINIRSRPSRQG